MSLSSSEEVDLTGIDIEAEYDKIYENCWFVREAETFEDKEKAVKSNVLAQRRAREEIVEYMNTEEYTTELNRLKREAEEKGEQIDPEKIYRRRRQTHCIHIDYTDDEKIALGIKGIIQEKERIRMVERYIPRGEFIKGTDYIFFSIENGGFASRNILVPTEEFNKIHREELEMLRRNAEMSVERDDGLRVHTLFQVYDGKDLDERGLGCTPMVPNEFNSFVGGMMTYAECDSHMGVGYGCLREGRCEMEEEREWYIKSICNGYGYFNPETGADTLIGAARENGCTVSESFMFLDKYINHPRGMTGYTYQYETPEELRDAIIRGEF